jgi:hypothetical protein
MRRLLFYFLLIFPILFLAQEASAGLGKPLPRSPMESSERRQLVEKASANLLRGRSVSAERMQAVREVLQRMPDRKLEQIVEGTRRVHYGGMESQGWVCLGIGVGLLVLCGILIYWLSQSATAPGDAYGVAVGATLIGLVLVIPAIFFLIGALLIAIFGTKPSMRPLLPKNTHRERPPENEAEERGGSPSRD